MCGLRVLSWPCRHLWADGIMCFSYVVAYLCNLLATPLDDQITMEAKATPGTWWQPTVGAALCCCQRAALRLGCGRGVHVPLRPLAQSKSRSMQT